MTDRRSHPWYVHVLAFACSPIAEKNPVKLLSSYAPIVLSMSRITVAVFTYVMARRLLDTKVAMGWPEAISVASLVFALPLLAALEKVSPAEVVAFGAKIIERFGVGAVAAVPPHIGMDQFEGDDAERVQ